MPGCATRCTTFNQSSRDTAWVDIRHHFGPRNVIEGSDIYNNDISEWEQWVLWVNEMHGSGIDPVEDVNKFGKWLIWRLSIGTVAYGNLPTRKRDHEGISCIHCPYSTASNTVRSRLWLSLSGTVNPEDTEWPEGQSAHGICYMKVAQRGNQWGFECTYSGCTYLRTHGVPYFHV